MAVDEEPRPATPPRAQQAPLPDSLELHRQRVGQQAAVAATPSPPAKKPTSDKRKGSAQRKRYSTEEKANVMRRVKELLDDGATLEGAAEEVGIPYANACKWRKLEKAGRLNMADFQTKKVTKTSLGLAQTFGDDYKKVEDMVLKRAKRCRAKKWPLLRKKLQRWARAFASG